MIVIAKVHFFFGSASGLLPNFQKMGLAAFSHARILTFSRLSLSDRWLFTIFAA